MSDAAYRIDDRQGRFVEHDYGDGVHLLADPFAWTLLARLCAADTVQPEASRLVTALYRDLLKTVVNLEFPLAGVRAPTRMAALEPTGVYEGTALDPTTRVTTVDIARAGILPSQVCFETLSGLLPPANVRQDHLLMSRTVGADDHVTGAGIGGIKLAGPIDGSILLFPDPMGATGSSLSTAIRFYKERVEGTPSKLIALNLIVTPEFIRRLRADHPDVRLYAYRLDRGMSAPDVRASRPGSRWAEERGLNDHDYIVPGGGGFGEVLNNALS